MSGAGNPIQYFRTYPSYDQQTKGSGLNLVFKEILNCKPVAKSHDLVGTFYGFNNHDKLREQSMGFAIDKRNGFFNTRGDSYREKDRFISDVKQIEGTFYALERNEVIGEYKLLKTVHKFNQDCNSYAMFADKEAFDREQIDQGKIHKCSPLNMIEYKGPNNFKSRRRIDVATDSEGISFFEIPEDAKKDYQIHDRIFISQSNGKTLAGQTREIIRIEGNKAILNAPIAGLLNEERDNVKIHSFSSYGPILLLAHKSGVKMVAPGNGDDEWVFEVDGFKGTNTSPITGMAVFQGRIFMTKGNNIVSFQGGDNIASIEDIFETGQTYDDLIVVGQYLIGLSPSKVCVVYARGATNAGVTQYRIHENSSHRGYRNKGSYLREPHALDSRFVIFDNYGELASYDIISFDDGISVNFSFRRVSIGSRYISLHLESLTRKGSDKVYITENNIGMNVFINSNQSGSEKGSKVLLFDRKQSFWHVRAVAHMELRGEYFGFYYGSSIFVNEGENDDGFPITQILSSSFGDISSYDMKHINSLTLQVGHLTNITNDQFRIRHNYIEASGYAGVEYYSGGEMNSCQYIKDLNQYKHTKKKISVGEWKERELYELLDIRTMLMGLFSDPVVTNNKANEIKISYDNNMNNYYDLSITSGQGEISGMYGEKSKDSPSCNVPDEVVTLEEEACQDHEYTHCESMVKPHYKFINLKYEDNNFTKHKDQRMQIAPYGDIVLMVDKIIVESVRTIIASGSQRVVFYGSVLGFMQTDSDLHDRGNEYMGQIRIAKK